MSLLHSRRLRILLPLVIFLFGCFNSPPSPEIVEPQRANVVVMGETAHLAPGSKASFLVQVRDPYAAPGDAILANRQVEVFLDDGAQTQPLFTGHTDDAGLVNVAFLTPEQGESGQQTLIIRAATDGQESVITQDVYIGRAYAVLITTDKPVYQPGQVIHLRALALDTLDLRAADTQTVTLTVADPQGNKLMQRALPTSQYGVASADFTLDSQATSGDYQITAEIGPNTATRTVEVKPYTLPRFEITFQPDQSFYLPGETATGVIEARYFFGKPVAGGQVVVRGSVTDVTRATVFEVAGETDADGLYRYAVPVPDFFVGQLDNQSAQIDLEIEVVDTANHLEAIDETITVAEKPLLIDAVPESGLLRPGLANRVYLDVSTPDGVAAPATLTITGETLAPITTTTDLYGLAVITLTAPDQPFLPLQVVATDDTGRQVTQPLLLGGATGASTTVLMRPERSEYKIGETANVDIYVNGHATTAYLDIIKGQQTFGLVALPVVGGVAQAALPIDGSLLGTLELNAYVIGDDGEMASDRRLLLVNPAPAEIDVTLDADRYRPGDTATLAIQVQRDGAPMPGVVGLAIVDESVFSVQAQEPGFARTYFLLERELQEPRYEIHDFVELEDDVYSPYDNLPSSIRYGARAQELALTGLFAQELAARQPVPTTPAAPSLAATLAMSWGNRLYLLAPLVGLALYDGSRKRRRWLIALTIFALGAFFWSACAAPAAAPAMPAAEAPAAEAAAPATTATQGAAAPRLRQYFPETLYWLPDLETDADGRAQVQVPIADSITTWRVSVLASDRAGNLGSAQTGLRVFQEFFVEPDLPRFLTVGDELHAPISIFNYLDQPQHITLDVAPGDWYELTDDAPHTLEIGPNAVTVAYVPIRVLRHGTFDFQITATGSTRSDAVIRTVEVLPDGQQMFDTAGGKLAATQSFTVGVPATAIPGTGRLLVRVYPGVVSQVLEGLEGLLQTPYGCFEQTSSVTYPNVMVLDYLKATGQAAPRIQLQAEQLINLGYQRLLTFEVRGEPGGFSLFGDPPAQMMLTAYGLMEFGDMAGVAYVDPDLMARVAAYLANWQHGDGSWAAEGMTIESGLEDIQSQLATTAYIAWGLADAGYEPRAVDRAVRFIEQALREAPATDAPVSPLASPVGDTAPTTARQDGASPAGGYDDYTLALAANALIAAGADATPLLNVLEAHATVADGLAVWGANDVTYLGGYGATAAIETTALVAQALLRADHRPDLAAQAINYLVANRDPNGAFYTTQATVQALKALVLAAHNSGEEGAAHVTVELSEPSGKVSIRTFTVEAGSADVVQQLAFENIGGDANQVQITVEGDRTLHYQLVTSYYLPWREVATAPETVAPMRVAVRYDRTELRVNETVQALATVELLTPGMAGTVLVDLGIPPGFAPVTADLDALAAQGAIDRYELTGRQIILYLTNVRSGEVLTFAYRLQAKYPIRAQTPASQVFDYYAPDQGSIEPPQRITVTLGTPEE
jgi:CD109 antigen